MLKFEWAECAAWRSQTVVAAHRRQSATVSGAVNINPCVFFCSCHQLRVFRLLCEKCLRRRVTVKNELLTLWQSFVDLDVEVGLLSTLWKIICCHWSTPARVLSSKQALLCKKLTTLCFHHLMSLCLLERVNSGCAKVAVIFEGVEVAASFVSLVLF